MAGKQGHRDILGIQNLLTQYHLIAFRRSASRVAGLVGGIQGLWAQQLPEGVGYSRCGETYSSFWLQAHSILHWAPTPDFFWKKIPIT